MNPISQERITYLENRNTVLNLMRQEIAHSNARGDETFMTRQQVYTNIVVELLQNKVEINVLSEYLS